jgi:hypothetical protein
MEVVTHDTDNAKEQYITDLNIPMQCLLVFLEKLFEALRSGDDDGV